MPITKKISAMFALPQTAKMSFSARSAAKHTRKFMDKEKDRSLNHWMVGLMGCLEETRKIAGTTRYRENAE